MLPGTELRLSKLRAEAPRFMRKMDCVSVDPVERLPTGSNWMREVKWDGYRICIIKRGAEVSIRTKANLAPSARYKHIEQALADSNMPECVLDGELLAIASDGRPSFQLLQQSRRNRAEIVAYIFDLLNYAGHSLVNVPLSERRSALESLASEFPVSVQLSERLPQDIELAPLLRALDEHGLEGIVMKLLPSVYTEGKAPGTWVKHRLYQVGEFVIGGYLKRDDPYFDALIVGQIADDGRLLLQGKGEIRIR